MVEYPVVTEVVVEVASALEEDPTELPPLAGATDPEALEQFAASAEQGSTSFEYVGCEVTIAVTDGGYDIDLSRPVGSR